MIANQITQVVDAVAQKLGVAAEAVYPMLLKQAEVSVVSYRVILWILGISTLVLIISIIGAALTCNSYNAESIASICIALIIISGVVALVTGIIASVGLRGYFTATLNPDAWVIEYVLNAMK